MSIVKPRGFVEPNNKINEEPYKSCKMCGGNMLPKKGKHGKFLGCSGFPDCDYTENK